MLNTLLFYPRNQRETFLRLLSLFFPQNYESELQTLTLIENPNPDSVIGGSRSQWGRRRRGRRRSGAITAIENSTTRRSWFSIRRRSTSSATCAIRSSPPPAAWRSTCSRFIRRASPSKNPIPNPNFSRSGSLIRTKP